MAMRENSGIRHPWWKNWRIRGYAQERRRTMQRKQIDWRHLKRREKEGPTEPTSQ
jgi:hypothetical protein